MYNQLKRAACYIVVCCYDAALYQIGKTVSTLEEAQEIMRSDFLDLTGEHFSESDEYYQEIKRGVLKNEYNDDRMGYGEESAWTDIKLNDCGCIDWKIFKVEDATISEKEISFSEKKANYIIGEYSIAGNYDDGYTVWKTADGGDSDTLCADKSFEKCVAWCLEN